MKYWAYVNNEIKGPFEPQELVKLDGFSKETLICPQSSVEEETKEWKEAGEIPEVALLITSKLPSKTEEISEPKELSNIDKKDEIIIERFSVENIFTPVKDVNQSVFSTDPLTLSQIRKRVEGISESTTPQTEYNQVQQTEDQNKEKAPTVEISFNQNEDLKIQQENSKDESFEVQFEVPSTDDLIKEAQAIEIQKVEEAKGESEVKSQIEEFKAEIKEFSSITPAGFETQTSSTLEENDVDKKINSKILEIKKILIDELLSIVNEKISNVELKLKELSNSSTSQSVDVSVLKDEVMNELERKISALSVNPQPHIQMDESLKKDFNDLKVFTSHLEIEIKDLKAKYEELENKIKPQPASLSRESIEDVKLDTSATQSFKNKQDLAQITAVELDEEKKSSRITKILLGVSITFLAILSVLFALKQFGVFDITSVLKSKQQSTINIQTPPQPQTAPQQPLQQADVKGIEKDTSSIEIQQLPQQPQIQQTEKEEPEIPLEAVINEVKDYKINSPYNLETAIKMVLKSRKADLSTLKWEASFQQDTKYLITATAKALKPVEFKFEFDYKIKTLQPLNTLSVNTLKMLMETPQKTIEKTSKNSSLKKNVQKSQTKRLKTIKKDSFNQSDENNRSEILIESSGEESNTNSLSSQTEENNDGDYLIIGE